MKYDQRTILSWVAILLIAILTAAVAGYGQISDAVEPPPARIDEVTDDYFGQQIKDPYRWMEAPKNGELEGWMKAQNAYTRSVLDRSTVRSEILKRIDEMTNAGAVVSAVRKIGEVHFYLKIVPGETDRKLFFRYGLRGTERLLVDPAKITDGGKRHSIIAYSPSQDGKYVSYLISPGGAELGEIRIVETATGRDLGERIERARWEAGNWLPDNSGLMYVRFPVLPPDAPETERFQKRKTYLHKLGEKSENDRPVFGFGVNEAITVDAKHLPFASVPYGSKYAFVFVNTGVSPNSEIYAALVDDLDEPQIPWRKIVSFEDEVSAAALHGDALYLLTYKNAPRFKVVKTNLQKPDLATAETVIPNGEAIVTGLAATSDALIVQQNDAGVSRLLHVDFKNGKTETVKLPSDSTISAISSDPRDPDIVFSAESWIRSRTIYTYDSKKKKLVDTNLQPTGVDTSMFESRQLKVKSHDGVMVPLSIFYKKGIKLDGTNPVAMSGYGSYGISQNPFFVPAFLAWAERGGIMAFAHVRGGGEMGREWHLGGFGKNKPNTWKDFIACAEYLIREKYTSPGLLAGHGASAGGILIGNSIAERPNLFGAAIIHVGLNNMLRYETTANGVPNMAEFGSVKTEDGFRNLLEMDAFQKIKSGTEYPAVMLTHGINDPRVEPWFSAKMAARLQSATTSGKPVLLRIDYDAGHGIGSTRKQANEEATDVITFLVETLKLKEEARN